jgi:hypothetical protein
VADVVECELAGHACDKREERELEGEESGHVGRPLGITG